MNQIFKILVVNTGSTSTKVAVFQDSKTVFRETIRHNHAEFRMYKTIIDQFEKRVSVICELLSQNKIALEQLDAVVGRGGILKPITSGVWKVTEIMLHDLKEAKTNQHASNLSGIIAYKLAEPCGIPAFIVDPVVVDELCPQARITGLPEIKRRSIFHALNQKACARKAAKELGRNYNDVNLVVAHMGGGISVGAHCCGQVIDVNNALNGDGPFSPERSGSLPVSDLIDLCFSGKYTEEQLQAMVRQGGGLKAYFGTTNAQEIFHKAENNDKTSELILSAMIYRISQEIAKHGATLKGKIDGIVLTGGLTLDNKFVEKLKEHIGWMGHLFVYPGEAEMEALRDGGLRVLRCEETAKEYV